MLLKQSQDNADGLERQAEAIVRQANQEISNLQSKVKGIHDLNLLGLQKECEIEKRRTHELTEQMNGKNRQFQVHCANYLEIANNVWQVETTNRTKREF